MEETQIIAVEPEKPQLTVFGTNDTSGILARARLVADTLAPIIEQRKLFIDVKGRKHVYVEGWTTMIALLGVFPHVVSCVRLDREDEIAYEAKVVLRMMNGQEVGAGEAICSSRERNWSNRDEYTIKSMAQTRAVGKACRLSFSWLIGMAGYEPCPVEELPIEEKPSIKTPQPKAPAADLSHERISDKQQRLIFARCKAGGIAHEDLKIYLKKEFGLDHTKDLSWRDLEKVLSWIDQDPLAAAEPEIPFK